MTRSWRRISEPFLAALLSPFPPLRPAAALFRRLGPHGAAALARHVMLPARRMGEELFPGEGAALLLGGNALHADVTPEAAGSGLFGWILSCLAQQYGYPVPEGGAGCLTAALVRRLEAGGGSVRCNARVTQILVEGGRAAAVVTEDGDRVAAGRAVLADVAAPALYQSLVGSGHLPPRYLADLQRFHWDMGTVKVDWALAEPVPWEAADARRAGTIHIADDFDNLTEFSGEIAMRRLPSRPFLLFGQQSVCDDTRSPPGTETAWAYTHVPRRITRDAAGVLGTAGGEKEWLDGFVERMEARVEELAPGFRALVRGRHVFSPADLEAADANLDLGAINGGTAQLHQQLIFRPVPGLARAETPIPGLFLASASAHPGGSVHGACGANAARAALGAMPRVRSVLLGRAPLERPRPGRS
jgi:phytoene dehydrogenase-like protein